MRTMSRKGFLGTLLALPLALLAAPKKKHLDVAVGDLMVNRRNSFVGIAMESGRAGDLVKVVIVPEEALR